MTEQSPYAVSTTLIILAPIFVAAGNYLLISRLIRGALSPDNPVSRSIFRIPVIRITKIFVCCDILSFLIQASGSGIAASDNWSGDTADIGEDVLLAGLGTQVATFLAFMAILIKFHIKVRREGERDDAPVGWRKILWSVYVSSTMVLVSCVSSTSPTLLHYAGPKREPSAPHTGSLGISMKESLTFSSCRSDQFTASSSSHRASMATPSPTSGHSTSSRLFRCYQPLLSSVSSIPRATSR